MGIEYTPEGVVITNASGGTLVSSGGLGTGIVGTAQIGTLTFNQIQGGTGVFGGTNSGSGVVSVLSPAGVEIARLDSIGVRVLGSNSPLTFGSNSEADAYFSKTFGLTIENTDNGFGSADIRLTTDAGNITLYALGTVSVTIGTAHILKVKSTSGGTLMTLNGNTGDLRIAGTIGTGIAF